MYFDGKTTYLSCHFLRKIYFIFNSLVVELLNRSSDENEEISMKHENDNDQNDNVNADIDEIEVEENVPSKENRHII